MSATPLTSLAALSPRMEWPLYLEGAPAAMSLRESEGARLLVANVRTILITTARDPSPRVTEAGKMGQT